MEKKKGNYGKTDEQMAESMEKLRELCRIAKPGSTYDQREIARFIGVSHEAVRQWERKALMSIRAKLESDEFKQLGIELKDIFLR